MQRRSAWRTVVVAAVGVALEVEAMKHDKHHETYSSVMRTVFHTDHPLGKVAFIASLAAFNIWFAPHILKGKER